MNFGHKNIDGIEEDDMNIKLHLNTSFDENNIQVSEELIRKTMDLINKRVEAELEKDETIIEFKSKSNTLIRYFCFASGASPVYNPATI